MPTKQPKLPRVCILQRSTPAIEATSKAGELLAGRSMLLAEGAQLLVCGAGFDEHTVKVLFKSAYYFVYIQHLKLGISHLSPEEWLEFAQNAVSADRQDAMQSHLDGGCNECRQVLSTWRQALDLSQREAQFRPPGDALQVVKSAFQIRKRWAWLPKLAEFARLVSDSARQPAPLGARALDTSSRHLLHETDAFVIDVQIEEIPARKRTRLTGQVLYSKEPDKQLGTTQVRLLNRDSLIAEATANTAGEFHLEHGKGEELALFFEIEGHHAIGISLSA
jgi:hypothetical protein